jgi:hypothetical protein
MRIIDTTQIVDPSLEQPLLGASLDFLTQNQLETLSSLAQSIIGPGYAALQVYVLSGCVVTGVTSGSGNFAMTAGSIFYGGEIFQVAAVTTIAVGSGNTVYSLLNSAATATDPYTGSRALDPVTFSDGLTTKNVHLTRTWVTSVSLTGSGTNPVSGWISVNMATAPITVPATGSGPSYAFRAGYSQNNKLIFWKDTNGLVHIQGDFTSAGTDGTGYIFTLPAGYVPARTVYGIMMTTGSNYATYKENIAYFVTIDNTGRVSAGYDIPSDAGSYSLIFQPFSVL